MGKRDSEFDILVQDLDEEVLRRMPEWFHILRTAYRNKIKP